MPADQGQVVPQGEWGKVILVDVIMVMVYVVMVAEDMEPVVWSWGI